MTKIRESAKGKDCTLQIFPYCNMNPETVVHCHINCEDKGIGIKSPDFWGARGCSTCHDIIDGRMKTELNHLDILQCIFRGIYRTQKQLFEEGLLK